MLNVNTGTINLLIELAREFQANLDMPIGEEPGSLEEDWESQALAEHAGNPVLQEFRATIEALNPEDQQQVVALMWLGRGDYALDEADEALGYAAEAWNPNTADYLISHPMLADHLATGLEMLASGEEK